MATIIRANQNDEFVDIPNKEGKVQSVIDQLGVSFKTSLETVWNYLKTIDVKLPLIKDKTQLQ